MARDLKESEAKCRAMVDSFDGAVYICSKDRKIEFANEQLKRRVGYDPVGKTCYRALFSRNSVCPWCQNRKVFRGRTVRWELQSPGDGRWYHVVNTPLRHADGSVSEMAFITDITDKKKDEAILRSEKEKFKAIFDQTYQLTGIMRKDGILLEANRTALRYVGAKVSDVLNKPFWKTPWWRHSEQVRARLRQAIKSAARGKFVRYETTHAAGDGSIRFVDFSIRPVRDQQGKVAFLIPEGWDITDRKRAEEGIRESRRELREIIDAVPHLICAKDAAGRFLMANRAMAELYGMRHEELLGKKQKDIHIVRSEAEGIFREDLKVIRTGQARVFAARPFTDVKKREHFLQTIKVPFKVSGIKAPAVLVVAVDVTEQKRVENFRNEIVKTLSHELRTPLSIGKGGVSLLLDGSTGTVTEEQRMLLETVMRNIERLSRMIDKLLDVSQIESGKRELTLKEVDLRDIVRETVFEFGRMARKKDVELTAVFGDGEAKVLADRDGITQVLTNLVDNALKFTSKGAVTVFVKVLRKEIECSVRDTGTGIAPENMAKVFEKFQRFSWAGGAGKEGMGLGLAIAKGIIEMHQGRIWAKSVPGEGTTVTFVLPRFHGKGGMENG